MERARSRESRRSRGAGEGGRVLDASAAGGVTLRVFARRRRSLASLKGLLTEHSKNGSRADPGTPESVGLGRTVVGRYQFFGGGILAVSGQQNRPPAGRYDVCDAIVFLFLSSSSF